MPQFKLGADVRANIEALREALGSATRELSRADLARLVSDRHPTKVISESAIRWWEQGKGEPDLRTVEIMANLAGVSYEQFALGDGSEPDVQLFDPTKDRKLTEQEIARAVRQAELEQRGQGSRAGKKRKGGRG